MLQNAYFLAKIGADTAENEQHFAENLPKIGNYPTGPKPRRRPQAGTNDEAGKADLIVLGTAYEQAWLDTFKFRITYVKDPQILRGSSSAVLSEISVSQFRREHQSLSQCAEIQQM